MKSETLVSKMLPQTCNLMSSGGSAFEALTAGDIQGLLMSCDATPLIWSFFEAKHQIRSKAEFENKLTFWLYNRIINEQHRKEAIKLDYLIKNHQTALNAAYELSEGLCGYLARHKISDDKYGTYFNIEKSKFSRYYKGFINECVADLESQLNELEWQIDKYTQNE